MSKIVFANNPLDRMSSIRSDEEWQKTSMISSDARYIIFDSGKPLIQVSKEPGSNSVIYLAKFDSIKKHFEACQIIFLGEMKTVKYYAIDITKERSHFDIEVFIGCKFIDLRSIAQSLSPEDTGILLKPNQWWSGMLLIFFVLGVKIQNSKPSMLALKKFVLTAKPNYSLAWTLLLSCYPFIMKNVF